MKRELDEKLCKAFPNLYVDRRADMRSTAMCWGFDCSEGWFDLIWELSEKLEALIISFKEENSGAEYLPCASQVKEKYGELCFYMTSATDEMWDLIQKAEDKSAGICEVCGKPGKPNEQGWIRTLCEKCRKEKEW